MSVTFQISEENSRGSGIWKMNTSILKQKQFKETCQSFWEYWQKEKIEYKNHNAWWDAGKMYLKTIIINFCTRKNKQINKKQQHLISYITQEKSKLIPNIEKLNKYQQELNDIENYKTEGTIIRSKEKVILNEEKPTKYFHAQEKQKQKKKNITTLIDEQGNTLQKNTEILNECENFYQKLYTNHKTCSDTQKQLLQQIKPKITELQNQKLTKQIQITEIQQALQTMENGKSPGIDGIPIEFYKEFFDLLKKDLQDICNYVLFEQKITPKTWNQAIISLIPKQTEKLNSLKYCRPISLLCTDYKILTKILANRLKQILPDIISQEQNCSIPQRTIFNNLFIIRDLIKYQKKKKILPPSNRPEQSI